MIPAARIRYTGAMILLDHGGAGRRRSRLVAPGPLGDLVEHVGVQHAGAWAAAPRAWRVIADPSPHLIVTYGPGGFRGVVVGSRTRYSDVDTTNRQWLVTARLRPGVLPAITGMPASAFTDRGRPLDEVFGPASVRDAGVFDEPEPSAAAAGLRRLLARTARGRAARDARIVRAVLEAVRVGDAAAVSGRSPRRLHQRIVELAGMPPRRLRRVERIRRALALGLRHRGLPWSEAAACAGFADQPHLVREFRVLLGVAPSAWWRMGADTFKTLARGVG